MTHALLFVSLMVILYLIFRYVIKPEVKKRNERKQVMTKWDRELENHREQRRQEKIDWNRKVQSAKRHLVGKDWRDSTGKEEFVKELFGEEIPQYLWYEFERLDEEEAQQVMDFFWDGNPSFGDLEPHKKLRVRNGKRFTVNLLDKCPLEQIGYSGPWDSIDDIGFPTGVVLFSLEGFYPEKSAPVMV